ncbi:hypothetical protein JAAARDRAFT_200027 [Jaapia argillacea MUCL 33604]|uniref:Uncharacterized protein n=1 Tax=Jaapia argillacea MUCL 33604 TaxID=933084 RepID=A0A067P6C8_9AGAM|nr:hypothetical protein JAAARDRAFT_200027 [Jaapia argillacea MUCL 33604]
MTDYDTVLTCFRVLDPSIRDQFGYKHLLWVYSGRRGIHLWISDKEAMELTDEHRKAIVGWIAVIQGGKDMHKKVNVRQGTKPLPPSLQTVVPCFGDLILGDQDSFKSDDGWEALLHLIPDKSIAEILQRKWSKDDNRSSEDKWNDLKSEIKRTEKGSTARASLQAAMEDIILQYTYPRIDAEVSKHRNHLLKAPFCVHPKAGRVCVPVDPQLIDDFDPEKVPTVGQLLKELDKVAATQDMEGTEHNSDWEKTSLKPHVDMLDRHAMALMDQVRRTKRAADLSW